MQSYSYRGIVSKAETEALKELIFNRARQRAEALAKDTQEQYTSSFRDELMDIARNSFNAPNNPFTQKTEPVQQTESLPKINREHDNVKNNKLNDIGFKQKTNEESIKEIIKFKNDLAREAISQKEIAGVMNRASAGFENSQKFMGALDFLNSQAGIYMASQRKAKFDALA